MNHTETPSLSLLCTSVSLRTADMLVFCITCLTSLVGVVTIRPDFAGVAMAAG